MYAIQTFLELEKLEQESDCGVILNPIVGPEPITGKYGFADAGSVLRVNSGLAWLGSSRMKGGSMTAILLDIIFMTALSRAFNISIHNLLSSAEQDEKSKNTLLQEPNIANGEMVAAHPSNGSSSDKTISSLRQSQLEIATLVDAFVATYNAAYRSVWQHLVVCTIFDNFNCCYQTC
jgi:hypothetical protein